MGVTLITPPAVEPVAVSEARSQLRIDNTAEDAVISSYIVAARQHAETYLRRSLITQTWELTLDDEWPQMPYAYAQYAHIARLGSGVSRVVLPFPPIQSVTSISYVDSNGATQVLASDQFRFGKGATGEWTIDSAYGVMWPSIRRQSAAITIRFVAGYGNNPTDVPETIRLAIKLLIGHWFDNRSATALGSRYVAPLPIGVDDLLGQYRVFY